MDKDFLREFFKNEGVFNASPQYSFPSRNGINNLIFFDLKQFLGNFELREEITKKLIAKLKNEKVDFNNIFGLAYGVEYYSSMISNHFKKDLVFIRKEAKTFGFGKGNVLVGNFAKDKKKILIIDDVICTGQSTKLAINMIKKLFNKKGIDDSELEFAVITVFTHCNPVDLGKKLGCKIMSLTNLQEVIDYGVKNGYLTEEEAKLYNQMPKVYLEYEV